LERHRVIGEAINVKALRASSLDGDIVPKTNAAAAAAEMLMVGFLAACHRHRHPCLIDLHALAVNPTKDIYMGRLILQGGYQYMGAAVCGSL
jgi:hypothetical protein